jgi:argininosuccinate lyase
MTPQPLWSKKGLLTNEQISNFTVGEDPLIDPNFLSFDCWGTMAHVRQLHHLGHLNQQETREILTLLGEFVNQFAVHLPDLKGYEDGHSFLEIQLTEKLGETGKKIHLGRSRNDQVLLAERLWMRHSLLELHHDLYVLVQQLSSLSDRYASALMPGYTHQRKAMPTTFGFWVASYAEGLTEVLSMGKDLYRQLNRSPLGAAAGFGSPIPLDRPFVAELLGFDEVQRNPLNVMSSRGRCQLDFLHWINQMTHILEKLFIDLSIFSQEEYQFVSLPDSFTTGSSIMPQKRNPDVLELACGRCSEIRGLRITLENISTGLSSSYHRHSQLQKFYLVRSFGLAQAIVQITPELIKHLQVHDVRMKNACSPDLFATHETYQLVQKGLPFREAYQQVGDQVLNGTFKAQAPEKYLQQIHLDFSHERQLCNQQLDTLHSWNNGTRHHLEILFTQLLECV